MTTEASPAPTMAPNQAPKQAPNPSPAAHTRNPRRRAREIAVQALYQWLLNPVEIDDIDAHMLDAPGFHRCDLELYKRLLRGVIAELTALQTLIQPCLDRPWAELSPVEMAVLLIASFELLRHPEVPFRVVLNEAVELTKLFGGTDGHKYVNGVLDQLAASLRAEEVARVRGH